MKKTIMIGSGNIGHLDDAFCERGFFNDKNFEQIRINSVNIKNIWSHVPSNSEYLIIDMAEIVKALWVSGLDISIEKFYKENIAGFFWSNWQVLKKIPFRIGIIYAPGYPINNHFCEMQKLEIEGEKVFTEVNYDASLEFCKKLIKKLQD
jgi:hypothetical protein